MNKPNRLLALLTYLIPVVVPLYVLFGRRRDPFALYHASRSLALVAGAIITPLVWAVIAWLLTWIPLVGVLLAAASFALVLAAYIAIIYGWISGIIAASQARLQPVPVFGNWGEWFLP